MRSSPTSLVQSKLKYYPVSREAATQGWHITDRRSSSTHQLILIISWIPGSINRIHNTVDPNNPVFGLFAFQAIVSLGDVRKGGSGVRIPDRRLPNNTRQLSKLHGLMIAAVYGANTAVRRKWEKILCSSEADSLAGQERKSTAEMTPTVAGDDRGSEEAEVPEPKV